MSNLSFLANKTNVPDILIASNVESSLWIGRMMLILVYFLLFTYVKEPTKTKLLMVSIVGAIMSIPLYFMGLLGNLELGLAIAFAGFNLFIPFFNPQQ